MADRYEKVFSLAPMLYVCGSPVIIEAGALLKDNSNNSMLAQLKFKSLSNKQIKAIKIKIAPFDTVGQSLGESIDYTYLDLLINRNDSFGSKQPIPLPNNQTRAFDVFVVSVAFDDNSIIELEKQKWQSIPSQKELDIDDIETEYFYATYNIKQKKELLQYEDLWLCSCGAFNFSNEDKCHICNNEYIKLNCIDFTELHNESYYQKANKLSNSKSNDDIKKANQIFNNLNGYKDSNDKIRNNDKKQKNKKKIIISFASAISLLLVFIIILTQLIIPLSKYNKANKLIDEQNYIEASAIFEDLGNFKDSKEIIDEIKIPLTKQRFSKMNTGETITLGTHYGSDIEWIILYNDKSGNILALSKYIVDSQCYDEDKEKTTWEKSSLRNWLNNDFYQSAFTDEEKALISEHNNKNNDTFTNYGTGKGGKDTNDKVSLLSLGEYYLYLCDSTYGFPNKDLTQAKAINVEKFENYIYVVPHEFQGKVFEDEGFSNWWLRSPGKDNSNASYVNYSGYIFDYGKAIGGGSPYSSGFEDEGVRPIIWINTNY